MNKNIYLVVVLLLILGAGVFYFLQKTEIKEVPLVVETPVQNVDEKSAVEAYLALNIANLSPFQAVLGGKWYVVSSNIDLEKDSGTVIYEDGHIQAKGSFTYILNDKGEVGILTITEAGELVKDFEGEADPDRMTLDMTTWNWISVTYSDGTKIMPKTAKKFTLTFKKDGTFGASTDCNGIGGNYTVKDKKITFDKMMSTLMYCEGSQENDFRKILEQTQSYFFTSKGELVLDFKFDSGSAIFR